MRKLLLLSCALLTLAPLRAQTSEATVSGVVTDPQGAVLPGAEVAAVHGETGVRSATRTNDSGFYSLRSLAIGAYTVSVEHSGFHRVLRENVTLTTGQALEMNFQLELGAVSESVTVSADASLLETRTSDSSQLIDSTTIEDMPLGDRRSMNVIDITGAAVNSGYDGGQKPNFSLAGGRMQSQAFFIDGGNVQNMRVGTGQVDVDPPIETLREVKVMSNAFSAEFGGSAAGAVIATTKSGTNQYKGSLFEYLRNQDLDAANFFSPIVNGQKQKPSLRYNVFGGTIGGPIRRDKTFFFASYEGSRRRDGSVQTLTVPSLLQRTGDFSQTYNGTGQLSVLYDPLTGTTQNGKTVRDPFPGNRLPTGRLDPVALKLLPMYPSPNRAPDDLTGANNFRANDVNALTRDNVLLKIDHNLSDANKLTGRYLYNSDNADDRTVYPTPAAATAADHRYHQQYWYSSWTRILSPSLINELHFTYGRRYSHLYSKGIDQPWATTLGLANVPDGAFPNIVAQGYANLGATNQDRRQFPIQQIDLSNSATWIHGRHTLKFGGNVRPSENIEVNNNELAGKITFDTAMTGQPTFTFTGNSIASLLLGIPSNYDQRTTPVLKRRSFYLAGFVQDDWNVRPGLTLNLGMRWEADTPIVDLNNRMNGFDPKTVNPISGTPGVVKFAGVGGWREHPFDPDWNNFGPRLGFAWRPFGEKTVLRGGFGIFYSHPFDQQVANVATLGYEMSSTLQLQDNTLTIPYTLRTGMPVAPASTGVLDDSFGAVQVGKTATTAVTYLDPGRRSGYSEQFNFGIQRELTGSTLVEVSYLGNLGRKLPAANINTNQVRPELYSGAAAQKNRPFPQFGNVTIIAPTFGVSSYNAGLVKFTRRFSHGLNVMATYTWSKYLDDSGSGSGAHLGDEGAAYSNYYNRRADWGPSENDVPQRFTWSSVYQVPIGRGHSFLAGSPVRHVLKDWTVGAVLTWQSGAPTTVQTQTNTTYVYSSGALRADILRNPNLRSDRRGVTRWFDTGAFAQPAVGMFGNQNPGLIRADGIQTLNGSLIRNFRVSERGILQFRGEVFNAPNHPNFGVPSHTFQGTGFGIVNSARPGRQLQLGLRLTY